MKTYLKNLSISAKIMLIIGINIVFLIVLGAISYFALSKVDVIKNQIVENSSAAMFQMNADMMHDALRGDVYNALLVDSVDHEGKIQVKADLNEHISIFKSSLESLANANVSVNIKKQLDKVRTPLDEYITFSTSIINAVLEGKLDPQSIEGKQKMENYKLVFDKLAVEMEKLSASIEAESVGSKVFSTEFSSNIKNVLLFLVVGVTLLALLVGMAISKLISKPIVLTENILSKLSLGEIVSGVEVDSEDETGKMLSSLNTVIVNLSNVKEFVTEVGNGNFDTEVSVFNNQGAISDSLNKMKFDLKQTAEEDKKRSWATEGMALFGDILRNSNDGLDALASNIVNHLVKYVGANQGALFVVNDNNAKDLYLELIASYAWDKKKYIEKRVQQGEGLIGQAWQEADVIYITEVPQNYVSITSGLGGANPSSVLIVPLTVNDITYGVIELASFHLFPAFQIEFIKKLAESIASTLSGAKTNERTKFLLEQSQQQAEEMRAQEEEMRQNMEEMQATSEEAERKSLNYEAAIQRLNEEISALSKA
jgi:transcriptional regulator with GAF, ATPase, and Fis domain